MAECPTCRQALAPGATKCAGCGQAVGPRWYVARGGKKAGPFTSRQLRTLASAGKLRPDDLVRRDGQTEWLPARSVGKLFAEPSAPKGAPKAAPRRRWLGLVAAAAATLLLLIGAGAAYRYWPRERPADPMTEPEVRAEAPPASPPAEEKPVAQPPTEEVKPPPVPPKAAEAPPVVDEAELAGALVRRLNTYRRTAGLDAVALDEALSRGCRAHAKYLTLNPPGPDAGSTLDEDSKRPGYSDEGKLAAQSAVVYLGGAQAAMDEWMARVASRTLLLYPELRAVGVGLHPLPGGRVAQVVDVVRGRGEARVVLYPAPDQTDVPLTFAGGPEFADPEASAGYPVTVTFPAARKVTEVEATLTDSDGKAVDAHVSTPAAPLHERRQRNSVALIPKAPLHGATAYRVRVTAKLDGSAWSRAWTFTTEDDTDTRGVWARKALDRVNVYRKSAGLEPVALDGALSKACLAHARYLARNLGHPATAGLGAHDEDPTLPGYSEEGKQAGKVSNIAIGDHDRLHGIDAWMATLYHRVPILEPNLKTVGFACARGRHLGWITVLNVGAGRRRVPRPRPVLYPAPDQANVPLHFPVGGEEPNPVPRDEDGRAGYPVTAFFPENNPLRNATATLTDAKGDEVPCWFSSPEGPANPAYQRFQGNTVCLIPKSPLRPGTNYRVNVAGEQAGEKWERAWSFTTGAGGPTSRQGVEVVVARLNAFRAAAGLSQVALDEAMSKGCQAHADYLVRNADVLAKRKTAPHEEDASLPGSTPEGREAARRADILSGAPAPEAQVEDLMGTFFRRGALLDPSLRRVGVGCANDVGKGWRCVLDTFGGRGDERVVVYPVHRQEDVPRAGRDRLPESDGPAGFPVTVTFPAAVKLIAAKAGLEGPEGAVDCRVSTADRPFDAGSPNTIALHPRQPLQPRTTYRATVSAVLAGGGEWRETWQFTTGE